MAAGAVSFVPAKILAQAQSSSVLAEPPNEKLRRALIINKCSTPPAKENLDKLKQINLVPQDSLDFTLASGFGYQRRRIAALSYVNHMLKTGDRSQESMLKLRDVILKDHPQAFSAEFRAGAREALLLKDKEIDDEFERSMSAGSAILSLIGGLHGDKDTADFLNASATMVQLLPSPSFYGSSIQGEAEAREVGDLLTLELYKLYKADPQARALLNNPLFVHGLNLNFQSTDDELTENAPPAAKEAIKKINEAKKQNRELTPGEQQQIAGDLINNANALYAEYQKQAALELQMKAAKQQENEIAARNERLRIRNEIQAGAHLIGQIGSKIFDDPKFSTAINTFYQGYEKLSALDEALKNGTAGILTAASTWVGLAASIIGILKKTPSFEEQVMKALQGIQKSIEAVNSRLDYVIETQRNVILGLQEILKSINLIHGDLSKRLDALAVTLNAFENYARTQDRKVAENAFNNHRRTIDTEKEDKNNSAEFAVNDVQRAMEGFAGYAQDVSNFPAYTSNDIRQWNPLIAKEKFSTGLERVDLAIGMLAPLYTHVTGQASEGLSIKNPVIFSQGAWEFSNACIAMPQAVNPAIKATARAMQGQGAKIREDISGFFAPEFIVALRAKYHRAYQDLISDAASKALEDLKLDNFTKITAAQNIYAADPALWPKDGKFVAQMASYKPAWFATNDFMFAENIQLYRDENIPANAKMIFTADSDRDDTTAYGTSETNVIALAQAYGIITLKQKSEGHISKIRRTQNGPYTEENYDRKYSFYDVVINEGEHAGVKNLKLIEVRESNERMARYRKLACNSYQFAFDNSHLNGKGVTALPTTLDREKELLGTTPEFLQHLLDLIVKKHEAMKQEFMGKFRAHILSSDKAAEFEALGAALTYLGGLASLFNGEDLSTSTYIAKDAAAIYATREHVEAKAAEFFDPKKIAENIQPKYSSRIDIAGYIDAAMQAELNRALDRYVDNQFKGPEKFAGNFQLNKAISSLDTVIAEQLAQRGNSQLPRNR